MTVWLTVRFKIVKRQKITILAFFSSFLNVARVLFVQTNDWCNNEGERKGKKATSSCFDQDSNPRQTKGHSCNMRFKRLKSTVNFLYATTQLSVVDAVEIISTVWIISTALEFNRFNCTSTDSCFY
jgi:hypothetical protein